jgi:hypothetical protein
MLSDRSALIFSNVAHGIDMGGGGPGGRYRGGQGTEASKVMGQHLNIKIQVGAISVHHL